MKTLELKKASKALADYATHLGSEPIVITANKKPVAVLVSLQGAERESLPLGLNPAFLKIIRRARAEVKRGEFYSLKQVKQETLPETGGSDKRLHPPSRKAARR